jgi:hypothetical protein
LSNVSFILLNEADFFPPGQQQADARDVSERYIANSNSYIVMVSTPNAPDGLFERIEKEAEDTCLYKRIFLDYTPPPNNHRRLSLYKPAMKAKAR